MPTTPATAPMTTRAASSAGTAAGRRDYWMCQCIGWGGLMVMSVLSTQDPFGAGLRMTLVKALVMLNGLWLSHGWRLFLRRRGWIDRQGTAPLARILPGLAVCSLLQVAFLVGVDGAIRDNALVRESDATAIVLGLCVLWYAIFLIWTLSYAVVLSRRRALRFELEKLELEVGVKDAELRALQAQVNPHFFFNSMNSIRALIYQNPDDAARAVGQLAGLMRHSLRAGQAPTVRLADEVAAVHAYLGIERYRFDERLRAEVAIAPGLDEVALPPMVLQTLVENAVKHGVEPAVGPCRVRVSATRDDAGRVRLTVANQGRLNAASASTRLGLANTGKRLALLFGPDAGCSLREEDGWVIADVVLPAAPVEREAACAR